jgi:hypothetical protein
MPLFPEELSAPPKSGGAASRMAITREMGTRKLVLFFALVLIVLFTAGWLNSRRLLNVRWPALKPDPAGLTVVGTLDSKASLGRNMFRVVDINQSFRPEITDYGWNYIFDGPPGTPLAPESGRAIKFALTQDSRIGYAMMQPYLQYGVARLERRRDAASLVRVSTPVRFEDKKGAREVSLGRLLEQYSGNGSGESGEGGGDEGGSEGAVDVEHGTALTGDLLVASCPVVLTGRQFRHADVEEEDQPLLDSKIYTARLFLTNEGRSRFYQWTHNHMAEHVVFIVGGTVLAAARVNMTMDGDEWEVGPIRDGAAVKQLVDFINAHHG